MSTQPNPSTPEATKYTPGPYEVVSKSGYPAVFGGGRVLCCPGGYSIAELKADKAKADEIVALAHLFAAAPDMLAALMAIAIAKKEPAGGEYWTARELATKWGIYADDLEGERVLLKLAEYAISKAEAQ